MKNFLTLLLAFASCSATAQNGGPYCTQPDMFEQLECEKALEEKRLEIETISSRRRELADTTGDGPLASNGFPTLRRVYGKPGDVIAQFLHNGNPIEVTPGDTVDGWKVLEVSAQGVRLRKGREDRWVLLGAGRRPESPTVNSPANPVTAALPPVAPVPAAPLPVAEPAQ